MTLLTRLSGARRAIEIGTFTGYSSICIARGLADGGRLICCDVSEEWTSLARAYWDRAGVAGRVELRLGPAAHRTADVGIGNYDFFDVVAVNFFQQPAEGKDLLSSGRGVLHDLIQQYSRRQNQDPEQNRFCCRIQSKPPTGSR